MHENRRKEVRHNIVITVQIKFGTSLSLQACENLSGGGAFFRHAIPFKVGTTVDVDFTLPGERRAIKCKGEVANVPQPGGYGMGVRFLGLTDDERKRITQFAEQFATAEEAGEEHVEHVEHLEPAAPAAPVAASEPAPAPAVAPAPAAEPVPGIVAPEAIAAAVAAAPPPAPTPADAVVPSAPEPAKIAPEAPAPAAAASTPTGLEESR